MLRTQKAVSIEDSHGYERLEALIRRNLEQTPGPWFTTSATGLFDEFLDKLPSYKQHYKCSCCRRFFEQAAGLVTLDDQGQMFSVVWNGIFPDFFSKSARRVRQVLSRATVTGVFKSDVDCLGTPESGGWTHLSGPCEKWVHPTLSADQRSAELKEDFRLLSDALMEISPQVIKRALEILPSLNRSEKGIPIAEWFRDLQSELIPEKRANQIWYAVAKAPAGWCHIKNTVVGALIGNIQLGYGDEVVRRLWNEKMDALKYQRPTAVSEGAIRTAEKGFEKMQAEKSVQRRYAQFEDVKAWIWQPKEKSNLVPEMPPISMSYRTWAEKVLPKTYQLELLTPMRGEFAALVTASDMDAPPIIIWDDPDNRNPVSWYLYKDGSQATRWNLGGGRWVKVNGICDAPCHWLRKWSSMGHMAMFVLDGCQDLAPQGGGLFKKILRSEFRPFASVIQALSDKTPCTGLSTASGLIFTPGMKVRVNKCQQYVLTSWE